MGKLNKDDLFGSLARAAGEIENAPDEETPKPSDEVTPDDPLPGDSEDIEEDEPEVVGDEVEETEDDDRPTYGDDLAESLRRIREESKQDEPDEEDEATPDEDDKLKKEETPPKDEEGGESTGAKPSFNIPDFEVDEEASEEAGFEIPDTSALGFDLLDEEQEKLELYSFAQSLGGSYEGLAEKYLSFLKAHNEFLQKELERDPDVDIGPDHPGYQAFLKRHKLNLTRAEERKLERKLLTHEAKMELKREQGPEMQKLRTQVRQQEITPQIQKAADDFYKTAAAMLPKEVMGALRTPEDYPVEAPIAKSLLDGASIAVEELLKVQSGVKPFDENNQYHAWYQTFLDSQAEVLLKSPKHEKFTKQGDKTFVKPSEFSKLKGAERKKHFTFSNSQASRLIAEKTVRAIKKEVSAENERIEKIIAARTKSKGGIEKTTPAKKKARSPKGGTAPLTDGRGKPKKPDAFLRNILADA